MRTPVLSFGPLSLALMLVCVPVLNLWDAWRRCRYPTERVIK